MADDVVDRLGSVIAPEHRPQVELIIEQAVSEVVHHSGPLPHASELARYNDIDASFAERIVRMAEREQEQRHAKAVRLSEQEYALKSRGQHYALLLAVVILLFAGFLGHLGDTTMAGKVALGTLVGIVAAFVGGRAVEVADRKGRSEANE